MSGAAAGCPGCGAALAGDERFCLACGLRLAPDELRLASLPLLVAPATAMAPAAGAPAGTPAFRRPLVRSAAITTVVVLAFGVAVGATIGPAAVGQTAAAQRPVLLVSTPSSAAAAAPADASSSSADDAGGGPADEVRSLADAGTSDAGGVAAALAAEAPVETPSGDEAPSGDDSASDGSGDDDTTPPAAAAPAGSKALAGVVVASAADGEGFVLAARDGTLLHVHASGCGVAVGDDLHLRARPLANGTWAADRMRRVAGGVAETRVAGTVAWVDPASGRYALGARGVTLIVALAAPPAAPAPVSPADGQTQPVVPPAPAVPALGARLVVRVAPSASGDGSPAPLVERARRDAPPAADPAAPAPPLELAGVVQSVDAQAHALVLAIDPAAQPPLTVALTAPSTIDLTRVLVGQRYAVTATAAPDGTLTSSGLSPDADVLTADDVTARQGDQATSAPADDETATTVASCTALDTPATTSASGLKTFTSPPPDRNERVRKRS